MTAADFIKEFALLADAPNGVQKLREMILQLAVQGKLVAQEEIHHEGHEGHEVGKGNTLYPVPPGWRWTTLRSVSRDLGQKVPDEAFTYIDVSAIDKERGRIGEGVQVLRPDEAPSRARKLVDVGTVIYSTVRPYLLNIAVVDRKIEPPPIVSTAFFVMQPFDCLNSRYLFYYLRSQPFTQYVNDAMTGMAYPAVNDSKMSVGPLPLPPLAEQKRIVAKVDELMRLCDELEVRKRKRDESRIALNASCLSALVRSETTPPQDVSAPTTRRTRPPEWAKPFRRIRDNFDILYDTPATVAELRKTILQLAVQGRLVPQDPNDEPAEVLLRRIANRKRSSESVTRGTVSSDHLSVDPQDEPYRVPGSWLWVRLGNCIHSSDAGWSPRCSQGPRNDDEWGVLKVSAVTWGHFNPDENKALPASTSIRTECEVRDNDFLVTRANTLELVARSVVVHKPPPRLLLSDKIVRLKVVDCVDRDFLSLANNSDASRAYYVEHASGTSSSMRNVTRHCIHTLPIPFPPLAEQKRIVAKVNELMSLCDALEAKLTQAREDADAIVSAVVHHLSNAKESAA